VDNNGRIAAKSVTLKYSSESKYCSLYSDSLLAGQPGRYKNFSLCHCFQTISGIHSHPLQCILEAVSLAVKQPGHGTGHSPSVVPRSRKCALPQCPIHLHSMRMLRHRDSFIFTKYLTPWSRVFQKLISHSASQ